MRVPSRSWHAYLKSRGTVFVGIVIIVVIGIGGIRSYYAHYQIRLEIARLEGETARLEAKKLETLEALQYVTSPAYVEEKARTELNLIKPGEQTAIIKNGQPAAAVARHKETDVINLVQVSNPAKWWNYFFNTSRL